MCCNLRTHAMVIAIICLIFTGLGSLNLISTFAQFASGHATTSDVYTLYGGNITVALGVQIVIYVYWVVSEVLCLVGAIKNNKCLLIPFMICLVLSILACAGATLGDPVPDRYQFRPLWLLWIWGQGCQRHI